MILAGDIGGTKTLLALYEIVNDDIFLRTKEKFESRNFNSFEDILSKFAGSNSHIDAAVLGVPGPVLNGEVKLTNLKWKLSETKISDEFNIGKVKLINDLGATAYSIPYLNEKELIQINKGSTKTAVERFAVLAPGTGLGEAFLICEGNEKMILSSEGGHTDFAPKNDLEIELLKYLLKKHKRVSYERIISGSGLANIFDFLVEYGYGVPNEETLERFKDDDKSQVISEMALSGKDKLCCDSLEIFASILGSHAGNLVLTNLTTGGVYLGGGIPHKIKSVLLSEIFLASFKNKGRLSSLLEATPVYIINNNEAALKGASLYAKSLIRK